MNHRYDFARGMLAAAALLVTGWLLGGANQRVVPAPRAEDARQSDQLLRARRIEIVDEAGAVLLTLGSDEQGGALTVRDRLGRVAVLASASANGGSLQLLNTTSGQAILQTKATEEGGELTMHRSSGRVALRATTTKSESSIAVHAAGSGHSAAVVLDATDAHCGRVRTFRPDGGTAVQIGHDAALGGMFETWSAGNRRLISLSATTGAHGRIDTWGPTGASPLVSIAANAESEGMLYTFNDEGRTLVGIATQPVGPAFRLYNQHGEPVIALQCTEEGNGELGVLKRDGSGRFITP